MGRKGGRGMIREITIYEANGVRFDDFNSASEYEDLCEDIERIMSRLKPRTEEIENCLDYGKQNIVVVKSCIKDFCVRCSKLFPDYEKWFTEVANGDRHISHIGWVISNSEYRIIYDAYFRFQCINMETGFEFQQPYYASNIDEAFEDIKHRQEYLKQDNN